MFWSLKVLEKMTQETTYSWRMFMKVLEAIVSKIIRDLTVK